MFIVLGFPAGYSSVFTALKAREVYAAARGTGGMAGTATVASKQASSRRKTTCTGSFQPDSGGPPHNEVTVHLDGACTPGRMARAHMTDVGGTETAYALGAGRDDWLRYLVLTLVLGLISATLGAVLVYARIRQSARRKQRPQATVLQSAET